VESPRSSHPPERLEVELRSRLDPTLSRKGYRVVGHGVTGITWRRDLTAKVIAGLVFLCLMALAGLASGDPVSIAIGVVCAAGAVLLFFLRRPATLTVSFEPLQDGTDIAIRGGAAASRQTPEEAGSLWSPRGPNFRC
jgi:hypothetical protein